MIQYTIKFQKDSTDYSQVKLWIAMYVLLEKHLLFMSDNGKGINGLLRFFQFSGQTSAW